jgi:TetR/AcrR family transcriptional regulator, transcriptional repressor for nem operon
MPTRNTPRSRAEKAALTRESLIAGGIAAIAEAGLDASLDDICRRAGFTRGAFYVHFRDRDDLVQAIMERVGRLFLEALFSGGTLSSTVSRFVSAVHSGSYPLTQRGGVKPHQLLDACARSTAVRARYVALIDQSIGQLAAQARRGQDADEVRGDVRADELALLIMCVVIGAQTLLELEVPLEATKLAGALMTLIGAKPKPLRKQ